MIGAIAGDVIGSPYEQRPVESADFELWTPRSRFTDDTVLSIATADAILGDGDYRAAYLAWGRRYPHAGYGPRFRVWLHAAEPRPYGSLGNGSAMRVGPVGWAFDSEEAVLREAERSASCSHDHPEGIEGAQAVALAVFLARRGADRETLRSEISRRFGYDLDRTIEEIRAANRGHPEFDMTCSGSVPGAIVAFLDAGTFEEAVRLAISLAGDADTQACMAGGIAEAFHGAVPEEITREVRIRLPAEMTARVDAFRGRFM